MIWQKHKLLAKLLLCSAVAAWSLVACTHRDTIGQSLQETSLLNLEASHGVLLDSLKIILPPVMASSPVKPSMVPHAIHNRSCVQPCTIQAIRKAEWVQADTSQSFTHWAKHEESKHPPSISKSRFSLRNVFISFACVLAIVMATPALVGLARKVKRFFKG